MDAPISVELIHGEVRTHTHPYSSMKSSKMPFPPPLKVDSRNVNFRSRSANSGGGSQKRQRAPRKCKACGGFGCNSTNSKCPAKAQRSKVSESIDGEAQSSTPRRRLVVNRKKGTQFSPTKTPAQCPGLHSPCIKKILTFADGRRKECRRQCKVCQRRVNTFCKLCKVALCFSTELEDDESCFDVYHLNNS